MEINERVTLDQCQVKKDSLWQNCAKTLIRYASDRINVSGKLLLSSSVVSGIYANWFDSANEKTNEHSLRTVIYLVAKVTKRIT